MKKLVKSFFEWCKRVSPGHEKQVFDAVGPLLKHNRERFGQPGEAKRAFAPSWGWVPVAAGAIAVAVVVLRTQEARRTPEIARVQQPAIQTAQPVQPPAPVQAQAQAPTNERSRKISPAAVTAASGVELARNMDLLLVLGVLRDLDVLQKWFDVIEKWRGPDKGHAGLRLERLWRAWFADANAADLPMNDHFLEDLRNLIPTLPVDEQKLLLISISRLQQLPPAQKDVLIENYAVWKKSSVREKQVYRNRFEAWKNLPETRRTEIARRYELWKKLSPKQRDAIRAKYRSQARGLGSTTEPS